ncbi:MAG: HD-GYP domain-containing protein [Bacillota bacterium]|nr:HD-GYP domain-containing protein [Bacillota bacterium]
MLKIQNSTDLRNEEESTLKWFLFLFYTISVLYDLFYDIVMPKFITHSKIDVQNVFGYWIYIFLFGLIPVAHYLFKQKKHYLVKYIYFITYVFLVVINESVLNLGKSGTYGTGNVVEIYWLLLAPIFVSKRFFWTVSAGLIFKYVLVGIIISSPNVFFPITMIIIFSTFAFILLNRFLAYVEAVKKSYNQQLEGIVKGVIATLELKDPYTRGHSERVAGYALVLAKEIGRFSEEELLSFNYACLLHDIGKINIPDHILMKPSSLTKEEYETIKSHPTVGAEAVSKVSGFQENIEVIRSHHERWDGQGYPDQLKGEEIPFLARVTAIADAFDAMTSSRSYRSALSVDEAYRRIIDGEGTQFDPQLVHSFQKVFPIWVRIHKEITNNTENNFNKIVEEII